MSGSRFLRVAVDVPLRRTFDYLPPPGVAASALRPGVRLRVPFGRRSRVAVLLALADHSEVQPEQLRAAEAVIDAEPILPPALLGLLAWAARYYQHPPGEVIAAALPAPLRAGRPALARVRRYWRASSTAAGVDLDALARRAPRQAGLLRRLAAAPDGIPEEALGEAREALHRLAARGLIETFVPAPAAAAPVPAAAPALEPAQREAIETVLAARGTFQPFLLEGVTGSGKTEVYLGAAERLAACGDQALVLVPEIGLTGQIVERFRARLGAARVAVLHSGLADGERLRGWLDAAAGRVDVVIGTRSAVWTPLARAGLIVVDEEHDLGYKQQEGLRYNARDLAVARARREAVPVVLGSATPALETLHNVARRRYRRLHLPQRPGAVRMPRVELVDIGGQRLEGGLSETVIARAGVHLDAGGQVLLFINRRGYAPVAWCPACRWIARCRRCDANMVYHRRDGRLRCHHCAAERDFAGTCEACGAPGTVALGQGTERVEEVLRARFPGRRIVRVDRDATRRKGALAEALAAARQGEAEILVGTQMLSKGHDFPALTLVGVLDTDARLYGADFRATERLAQLLVQVAGRAGRAARAGEVLVQTRFPDHPLFRTLFGEGYASFAETALAERHEARLPPFSALALLRAQAKRREQVRAFLERALEQARAVARSGVTLLGPVPAPMERRAGSYRAHLLVEAPARRPLGAMLERWVPVLERLPEARRVHWSLDVDPQEIL